MTTHAAPYIHFVDNNAGEAFAFYGTVFGCTPDIRRVADTPMPGTESMPADMVMHAELRSPDGINLYGSDDCMGQKITPQGFEICIMTDDHAKATAWFDGLSEGGTVDMPFAEQPWGDTYGQLTDRFGQTWAINCSARG